MLIFKDIITGDEMFTDAYPHKLLGDVIYEIEGQSLSEKGGIDDGLIGGNASADGGAEAMQDNVVTGMDLIVGCKLQEVPMSKADFKVYIKGYMGKIVEHLNKTAPERVPAFKQAANTFFKKLMETFKEWRFYFGPSYNPEGGVGFLNYRDDEVTPYMVFFKDGFISEKQ